MTYLLERRNRVFSIEELYQLYKKDVYYYLLSLTHNPVLSEDLLSETFVCAIKSLPNYKGTATIKTWLFGIARNLWLQSLRNSGRELLNEKDEYAYHYISDTLEDHMIKKELAHRIQSLLQEKDSKTKQIVSMRIHGYSYYEIAKQLEISESSARVIDFRTKNWIRSMLEKEGLSE